MYRETSEGYRDAVESLDRSVSVFLSMGVGIDNTAADDIIAIGGDFLPMSNGAQVYDANYELTPGLATYEGDGIPTASSAGMIVPPLDPMRYPPEVGIWSAALSDAEGGIDFTVSMSFSRAHTSAFRIYTDDVHILAGTVEFSDGSTTETAPLACETGSATITDSHTYTSLTIHITSITAPYAHARIVEVEFGASVTLARDRLGETLSYITELDPLELSIPLSELNLSLVNVTGEYDVDNPSTLFRDMNIGNPINLSFTVETGGIRHTVPCGRFYIASKKSADTMLRMTAYDARWTLSAIYTDWTLDASTDLATQLDALLQAADIPHSIDESVSSIFPVASHTFTDDTSLLDDLLRIQQAYAVYILPDRSGTVRITDTFPTDTYGQAPLMGLYTWPDPVQFTAYNFVSIQYGGQGSTTYHEVDLRTSVYDAKTQLRISNPLILDLGMAQTLANRIIGRIYTMMTETTWRGDPTVDLGDSVSVPGKWTQDAPTAYSTVRIEMQYDGAFRMVTRGTR